MPALLVQQLIEGRLGFSARKARYLTTWIDPSAHQVGLMAFFGPRTVTARRAGRPQGCYHGGSGSGEAVEALGRSDEIHQGTRDRSERSTSPDPRGPWTHHLHRGGLRGLGRAWMGGQWVDMRRFLLVFCPQSKDVIPFDVLVHFLWPPDKLAARELG